MRTASEKAAAFYRAAKEKKEPPRDLPARARAIWRQIVLSKPADWFDGGSLGLLADHCQTQARLEECWRGLAGLPAGAPGARPLISELRTLRNNFTTSSRQLRLTVSNGIERQAAKASESAADAEHDDLIGGTAKRLRAVG